WDRTTIDNPQGLTAEEQSRNASSSVRCHDNGVASFGFGLLEDALRGELIVQVHACAGNTQLVGRCTCVRKNRLRGRRKGCFVVINRWGYCGLVGHKICTRLSDRNNSHHRPEGFGQLESRSNGL